MPVYRLADTVAVPVIGIGIVAVAVGHGRQFAPRRPGEDLSVVIGQRLSEVMVDTMTSACLPRHFRLKIVLAPHNTGKPRNGTKNINKS